MMNIDQLVFSSKDNESEQSQINTKFMDNEEGFTLRKWNQVKHRPLTSQISTFQRQKSLREFYFHI